MNQIKLHNKLLGNYLKNIRESLKLTCKDVAAITKLDIEDILRIESGTKEITAYELYYLSNFYNRSMDEIIDDVVREKNDMKGIILAGGTGTRLYPNTMGISKQLVPIYDKPMIYYPLSVLMQAGIRDILIITTEKEQGEFKRLLGNGSRYGINLEYAVQPSPDGLAEAFIIGKDFIKNECSAMILGDNIFYGSGLKRKLYQASLDAKNGCATIFGYQVKDPERFGIMELDKNNNILSIEEKPKKPKSDYAVTGLYFYPKGVYEKAKKVMPSQRGELEITSLNAMYLEENNLKACLLNEGYSWFDTGTFDSLLEASNMIKTIESNRDSLICSPEKIAYENKWITEEELYKIGIQMSKNTYGQNLLKLLKKGNN